MTGPVCVNVPFAKTTSIVEYYHILLYKEILFELLNREWPSDGNVEVQDMNSTSNKKPITKVSTPKQSKQAIGAKSSRKVQNSGASRLGKNSKRKFEASRATDAVYAEGPDGESPTIQIDSRITKATTAAAAATVLQDGVQMGENEKQKQSICTNIPQDIFPIEAPRVDAVMKDAALERQIMEVPKSGGVAENNNDEIRDSVRTIQKIRDSILHKEFILQDRTAQCDMDIQKIFTEEKMTTKVLSIMERYKDPSSIIMEVTNPTCSGDGGKTKRMGLREALAQRDKCMELDAICRDCDWISPRYTVVPSLADGMYIGEVRLKCPDFEMSITGDPRPTPHDARCSAAANMILELQKAEEKEQHDN